MKSIIQEESSGCGIACVAILAGVSYAEVKRDANEIGIYADDEKLWSETEYVRRLLTKYGIVATKEEIKFQGWNDLPITALLAVKYRIEAGRPLWHWVVFHRPEGKPRVLDPAPYLERNERVDFDAMNPEWFIEIWKPD